MPSYSQNSRVEGLQCLEGRTKEPLSTLKMPYSTSVSAFLPAFIRLVLTVDRLAVLTKIVGRDLFYQ